MKKVIKIAHLYYDLMNLYGESGNVKALKRFIERQGIDVEIHFLTLDDKIDFKKYDVCYIGAGSEENELMVLSHLYNYKDDIRKYIEDGKTFIATGNSMELFGKKIREKNGHSIECLGIFDYNAVEAKDRLVSELFYEFDELELDKGRNIIGFKNCNSNIVNNDDYRMFEFPDNIHYKNFYGMMFVGPVLIRNPYFTNYILKNLFETKGYDFNEDDTSIEFDAYREFIRNFILENNLD